MTETKTAKKYWPYLRLEPDGVKTSPPRGPQARILKVILAHSLSSQSPIFDRLTPSLLSPQMYSLCSISTALEFWVGFAFPELLQQPSHWSLLGSHLLPTSFLHASRIVNTPCLKFSTDDRRAPKLPVKQRIPQTGPYLLEMPS